jgi:hypothetical protein
MTYVKLKVKVEYECDLTAHQFPLNLLIKFFNLCAKVLSRVLIKH